MPPSLNEILVMTQKEGNVDIDRCVTKGLLLTLVLYILRVVRVVRVVRVWVEAGDLAVVLAAMPRALGSIPSD